LITIYTEKQLIRAMDTAWHHDVLAADRRPDHR
jgi:hypothetical protein